MDIFTLLKEMFEFYGYKRALAPDYFGLVFQHMCDDVRTV